MGVNFPAVHLFRHFVQCNLFSVRGADYFHTLYGTGQLFPGIFVAGYGIDKVPDHCGDGSFGLDGERDFSALFDSGGFGILGDLGFAAGKGFRSDSKQKNEYQDQPDNLLHDLLLLYILLNIVVIIS